MKTCPLSSSSDITATTARSAQANLFSSSRHCLQRALASSSRVFSEQLRAAASRSCTYCFFFFYPQRKLTGHGIRWNVGQLAYANISWGVMQFGTHANRHDKEIVICVWRHSLWSSMTRTSQDNHQQIGNTPSCLNHVLSTTSILTCTFEICCKYCAGPGSHGWKL